MAGEASDLGNRSFVLPCGDEASLITCPDGWIGEAYDINNVWIYLEDESHYLDYYYMTDWTEDDFLDQVQSDIDELKDLDIFISSGDGPVYEGFTTKQVLGKDESYCYAWAPKGDGYLLVVLADNTAKPDFEAQILDAMALIAPYTGDFVEKAVATELGGGVFSLPCDENNLIITCPEGWSGEVYDVNNIWTYNSDGTVYGDFFYLNKWTEADIMTLWVEPDMEYLKGQNTTLTKEDGPVIDGFTTTVLLGDHISYYYAWTAVGNGYLLIQVYDLDGGNDTADLVPAVMDFASFE